MNALSCPYSIAPFNHGALAPSHSCTFLPSSCPPTLMFFHSPAHYSLILPLFPCALAPSHPCAHTSLPFCHCHCTLLALSPLHPPVLVPCCLYGPTPLSLCLYTFAPLHPNNIEPLCLCHLGLYPRTSDRSLYRGLGPCLRALDNLKLWHWMASGRIRGPRSLRAQRTTL